MIASPRPTPELEIPQNADVESWDFSDEAQFDAFCEELLAALTKLERSPAAWSARACARFN